MLRTLIVEGIFISYLAVVVDLPPYISFALSFFAGLSLLTGNAIIKGNITLKWVLVKSLNIGGLLFAGLVIWSKWKISMYFEVYIFFVTLASDIISEEVFKSLPKWLEKLKLMLNKSTDG